MHAKPEDYSKIELENLDNDQRRINLVYEDDYTLFIKRDELKEISEIHDVYNEEVFCMWVRIISADYKTFTVFDYCENTYSADKDHIYCFSRIIEEADLASFKAINYQFAKDKKHVYFFERPLQNVSPETFVYQEGMYGETTEGEYDRLVYP